MRRHLSLRPAAAAVALLALGPACDTLPVRPAFIDIRMSVSASPSPGSPSNLVIIETRVVNAGRREVWHCVGCQCDGGSEVLGPDGTPVALDDPNAPKPDCASGIGPFAPGDVWSGRRPFTGILYVRDDRTLPTPTYPAPRGTYTIVARFGYAPTRDGEWVSLERTTTFVWEP